MRYITKAWCIAMFMSMNVISQMSQKDEKKAIHSTTWHSTAQHSTAQHSTAQHSTAQPSPAQPTPPHHATHHSTSQHIPSHHIIPHHIPSYPITTHHTNVQTFSSSVHKGDLSDQSPVHSIPPSPQGLRISNKRVPQDVSLILRIAYA
jgi:hypothetical protein